MLKAEKHKRCAWCQKSFELDRYQIQVTRWCRNYHISCYGESDSIRAPHRLSELIDDYSLSNLDEQTRAEIIHHVFPGVIFPEQRPYLSVSKPLSKMKKKELETELLKRDLLRIGKKQEMIDRLEHYLDTQSARKMKSELLVVGHCRRMEGKRYKMNIPIYLKQIVVDFFGVGLYRVYRFHIGSLPTQEYCNINDAF